MTDLANITSREGLYNYFDDYTSRKKDELNRRSLEPGQGLVKAYLVETSASAKSQDVQSIFHKVGWQLTPVDSGLYRIANLPEDMQAALEMITPRYGAIYTTAPSTISDKIVRKAIRDSVQLDNVWLTSAILNSIWQELTNPDATRYATLLYEKEAHFEGYHPTMQEEPLDEENASDSDIEDDDLEPYRERPLSRLEVKGRIRELRSRFGEGSRSPLGDLTGNLTRVRMPAANERGRYEFFANGKLTDRGAEFRGFAAQLRSLLTDVYGALTTLIEDTISFSLERQTGAIGRERWAIRGAPVTFHFHEPLNEQDFRRFIELTFERGAGPFRLWGNPLWRSGPKVHIYGLDLHLWQQIYLDLSPKRFIAILPEGTCGNTVHRLAANIQRYLDPQVEIYIGDSTYQDLLKRVWKSL